MRNKIFVILAAIIVLSISIYSPINSYLMDNGYIEYENAGNIIKPEKHYDEDIFLSDFFNLVEEGKANIKDVYINHLPFYLDLIARFENIKDGINKTFRDNLQEIGNIIVKENIENFNNQQRK